MIRMVEHNGAMPGSLWYIYGFTPSMVIAAAEPRPSAAGPPIQELLFFGAQRRSPAQNTIGLPLGSRQWLHVEG